MNPKVVGKIELARASDILRRKDDKIAELLALVREGADIIGSILGNEVVPEPDAEAAQDWLERADQA